MRLVSFMQKLFTFFTNTKIIYLSINKYFNKRKNRIDLPSWIYENFTKKIFRLI